MKDYASEQLRNIGLFSHGGAGKTSLGEAMLLNSGAINRLGRVDEGTTVSDYDPDETKRQISVYLSLLPFEWKGVKINIIDTPGYADFVGEVLEGIRIADTGLILMDAVAGIEVGTEMMWKYAENRQLPRMIFINKIDRENADFARVLEQAQARFGSRIIPIQLPIGRQDSFKGVIDLITMKARIGAKGDIADIPADLLSDAESAREKLLEIIAETDDDLITKYLEGEELTDEEIAKGLKIGILQGKVIPVLVGTTTGNLGVVPLMDTIVNYSPSPVDMGSVEATNVQTEAKVELQPTASAPLSVLVFKTAADPYVGKLTYLRVYSGNLKSDSHVWNANKGREERIGQLYILRGKTQEPASHLTAGDIGAVAKLAETVTGDTLGTRELPVTLEPVVFPKPSYSVSIHPKTKADLDKLSSALTRLAEEDPTITVTKEPGTGETVLSGMGESHSDVAVDKMKRKFGVEVKTDIPKVSYKETVNIATKAEYKHKKQTGGHGQYGHVFLEIQPLPRGTGFEFADRVVGGVVPRNYIPAVEKGVTESLGEGVLAHYPVTDIKVTLYDGSYHPVDSSEMAFKLAASQAFKKGVLQAQPVLLEPVMKVEITVPESFVGDVMSDLNSKRARVLGMDPQDGSSIIEAYVPQSEMLRYAIDLRSITQGRGTYTMGFSHYEEVPVHIAQGIIAETKKEAEKE